jgi:hypothetical protein
MWGKIVEQCAVPEFKKSQLVTAFREACDFIHAHAQNWCDYTCDVETQAIDW